MLISHCLYPKGRPENGCLAIWNNVRAVPLSFDAQANMDEEYSSISDYSCDTNSEDERDVQNTNEDEKYKQLSSMHAQNDVVNSVLNPGNRKRDIVSSWFTDSCFNINNVEKYQSPVLIPSYKRYVVSFVSWGSKNVGEGFWYTAF